jgi:hypothetical protein
MTGKMTTHFVVVFSTEKIASFIFLVQILVFFPNFWEILAVFSNN